jgi:ATP-dependent exoDNAse (exonuclease V) alpha subunit
VQELRSVRLRNLYRILRRPEAVFDIVTRHHATFMWGDVQKILGRYVDTPELFQRLDARLKNSSELLLLKTGEARDQTERIEERSIYTTRAMLRSEKALVSTAEALANTKDHAVSSASLERGLERIQARLQTMRCSLSSDQTQAIEHLVSVGQLKCIVGYAGAGKTTALEACKDIWEDSGYKVYGLAPTGRAAQNLEGSGISSQTLHKFLKSFEEGRCQYSDKSVLVLDEAGMVDVERFEAFLGAVKALGVKAVVVGDGAQLQPVEAGPAFRLVTERVGVSRLESVVRQRQDWQREATVLFGKQESKDAIQAYQHRGHVHLVEEALPQGKTVEEVISRYEISARTSGLIFREIMKEIKESYSEEKNSSHHVSHSQETQQHADESQDIAQYGSVSQHQDVSQHRDYAQFLKWRSLQKEAGREILGNAEVYGQALEARGLDPLEMARLFVDKKQDKSSQYKQAGELLKDKGLDHLIGGTRVSEFRVEVRSGAKSALIEDWKRAYKQDPQKSLLMMAYSNRDVRDLNMQVRSHLKASGVLGKEDMAYTITREVEDDFGRKKAFKQKRSFSKGDKLVFTRNNFGLGVQNGTVGTITDLNTQNIKVKVGETQEVSFSPRLNPYFDQGWAITIHKSQGTTVDKSFLLASHEMNQNLTYVAMTRHREDVQVYGSHLDFWRTEKVADILSKSGEKLGAADYLDSHSLAQLMKDEDHFLTQLFTRLGDELHAMRAVSKQVFKVVLDHFLGRPSESALERPTLLRPEILREEDRAHEIFQKTQNVKESKPENGEALPDLVGTLNQLRLKINHTIQDVYEDWKHPAFKQADFYKRVFEKGLNEYGEQESVQYWNEKREPYIRVFEEKIEHVERELQSPFLSYMSDKSRDLARKAAFEDPDRALEFLDSVKASKQAEQREQEKSLQHKQDSLKTSSSSMVMKNEKTVDKTDFREVLSSYFRFKELRAEYERSPYDPDLQKELKKTGEALFNNKEGFNHIKGLDPDLGEIIKKIALDKQRDLDRSLERILQLDRGGLSL